MHICAKCLLKRCKANETEIGDTYILVADNECTDHNER